MKPEFVHEAQACRGDEKEVGGGLDSPDTHTHTHPLRANISRIMEPLDQDIHVRGPWDSCRGEVSTELKKDVHFELAKFVVREAQVEFVQSEALPVDLSTVGAIVAIRAKRNEIIVLMGIAIRPRNDVVNLDLNVSTGRDCAAVACFDQNLASYFCGNLGAIFFH